MKIAFLGNCQATTVAELLNHFAQGEIECRAFEPYHDFDDGGRLWLAKADIVFEQPLEREKSAEILRVATGRIQRMPLIGARFLWPFVSAGHPRNAETITPWHGGGVFHGAVVDDQLCALMQKHDVGPDSPQSAVDDVIAEYLALDYAELADLSGILERDFRMCGRIGGELGAQIAAVVQRDFRSLPLFFNVGGLGGHLIQLLACGVAAQIGLPMDKHAASEAWFDLFGGDEPPFVAAPVHPSVLKHFGIEWAGSPGRFRWHYDGFLTMAEVAGRAIRLRSDEPTALFYRAERHGADAWRRLSESLPRYEHSPFFRLRYGVQMRNGGRPREAATHFAEAVRLLPDHAEPARAGFMRQLSRALAETGTLQAPPRIEYDTALSFAAGGAGVACLGEGWYGPESWGCWARGYTGRLRFAVQRSAWSEGARLHFRMQINLDASGAQSVRVFVNGREVAWWRFRSHGAADKTIHVGPWIHDGDAIEVAFFVGRPGPASERGDTRLLALGLIAMTVQPL
jgi:hypothetical protein